MNKIAAIWARVSTSGQTSLPDQVARAREKLQEKGYIVPEGRILAVDWSSLDLSNCPEFLRLYSWVTRKEIQAIGMLDRDRLHSDPIEARLAFLSECRHSGVEVVLCQGPEIIEGDEGGLLEHVYTIGRKQAVLRAKLGAKQGMADKVTKDRKPTSKHRIFGYRWVSDLRLEPENPDYDTFKVIFDLAVNGATYFNIQKALKKRGTLSPNGLPEWDRSTIRSILYSPIYAGCYYALKHYVVEPKKRLVNSYGNSSAKTRSLDEAVYLPEVEIVNPPIAWDQYLQILERRKVNQKLASRNGKREYLLRGFIHCYTHYGKRGEPRVYYGRPNGNSYVYACPIGGCAHPNLNGPKYEEAVKQHTRWLLNLQPEEFYRQIGNRSNVDQTRESLEKELKSLDAKHDSNLNRETDLENRDLLGQVHPEVYQRLKSSLQAERIWIEQRREAIQQQLEQLSRQAGIVATWREVRERFTGKMDELSNAEWRELFIALNLEVHVRDGDNPATWPEGWYLGKTAVVSDGDIISPVSEESTEVDDIEIWFGIPLGADRNQTERVGEIVFNRPYPFPPHHTGRMI